MYIYSTKRHRSIIKVTDAQMTLLKSIDSLGFVNLNQLDMLWSVANGLPSTFSKSILNSWVTYDGLLKLVPKEHTKSLAAVSRAVYTLTPSGRKWLDKLGISKLTNESIRINSHNEQAIEVIVQGLYSACFKSKSFINYEPLFLTKDPYSLVFKYIKGCQNMSLLKVPSDKLNMGAILNVYLGAKNEPYKNLPQSIANLNKTLIQAIDELGINTMSVKDILPIVTYLLRVTLVEGTVSKVQLSDLFKTFNLHLLDGRRIYQISNIEILQEVLSDIFSLDKHNSIHKALTHVFTVKDKLRSQSLNNLRRQDKVSTLPFQTNSKYKNLILNLSSKLDQTDNKLYLTRHLLWQDYLYGKRTTYILRRKEEGPNHSSSNYLINDESYLKNCLNQSSTSFKLDTSNLSALNGLQDNLDDLLLEQSNNNVPKSQSNTSEIDIFQYSYTGLPFSINVSFDNTLHIRPNTKFNSLPQENQCFVFLLAAFNLYLTSFLDMSKDSDPLQQKKTSLSFTDSEIKILSNKHFDINKLDLRSFNKQFGYTVSETKDLPFVADMMISFKDHITSNYHQLFLELDNRTESNSTQIQKILNYIWYALKHPNIDIAMIIAVTDGSLSSKRMRNYTNVGRKLGNLVDKFLHSFVIDEKGKRIYLKNLYQRAKNLHIYCSGVSEAHIDVAEYLMGSNHVLDALFEIDILSKEVNNNLDWHTKFSFNSSTTDTSDNLTSLLSKKTNPILGTLTYKNGSISHSQLLISGQEHSLDTAIAFDKCFDESRHNINKQNFIGIFPPRLRSTTAISTPTYSKNIKYLDSFVPVASYYLQPRDAIDEQYMLELRQVTLQFPKEIYNYFLTGAISKVNKRKKIRYADIYPTLYISNKIPSRSYLEIHQIAKSISNDQKSISNFSASLRLDEIPLDLYKELMGRWPKQAYAKSRILHLPYVNNQLLADEIEPKKTYNFISQFHCLNSTIPSARKQIKW